jgi:hypothetical protein
MFDFDGEGVLVLEDWLSLFLDRKLSRSLDFFDVVLLVGWAGMTD